MKMEFIIAVIYKIAQALTIDGFLRAVYFSMFINCKKCRNEMF